MDNPFRIVIDDFAFEVGDRFAYKYNFFEQRLHGIRVEAIHEDSTLKTPFCMGDHVMPGATAADDAATVGELRPGDVLLVHSVDRLCRNISDMCAVTTRLRDQGVTLICLKEQLTFRAGTNNPIQELQLNMMSAFSQFERALLK